MPWTLKEMGVAILTVIGISLILALPFAGAALEVAGDQDSIDEDPLAFGLNLLGGGGLQVAFVIVAWFFVIRRHRLDWKALGFRRPERGSWWFPIGLWLLATGIVVVFQLALNVLDLDPDTDFERIAYTSTFPIVVLIILTMFLAPLGEEIFLRGYIFQGLSSRWGPVIGAVGSGVLFGAAHLLNPGGLYVVWPITAIGILFAWGFYFSRSIIVPIVAHFLFNGFSVLGTIAYPPEEDEADSAVQAAAMLTHLIDSAVDFLR